MIFQILRTVLFGAVIYFFSKVTRNMIDQKMDGNEKLKNNPQDQRPPTDGSPAKLVPCPSCNIYYNPNHPPDCGKAECPLKSAE